MSRIHDGMKREAPSVLGKVPKQYPWLSEDKHCDVCVIGGGMTGAMCALSAAENGLGAVLITSDAAGYGDTGHITGCARFDGGRTLTELDRLMTVDDALKLCSMGMEALDGLQNLCARLDREYEKTGFPTGFERRDLLVFTSDPADLALLEREYIAFSKRFPDCSFLSRKTAASAFEFPVAGGILTPEGSAVFSPYALTHLCLMKAEALGAEIFEQTEAVDIQTAHTENGGVMIHTSTRRTVYTDRLVFAAGSEGTPFLCERVKKHTLFAVTAPLAKNMAAWSGKCTLGKFGSHSENGSISSGGRIEASGIRDSRILGRFFPNMAQRGKFSGLTDFVRNVIPEPEELTIQYEYSYPFLSSPDGLPIIGKHDAFKKCFFAIPGLYSGAGMPVYSYIASKMALKTFESNITENFPLFDPMRFL